jgi:DNA-binding transcriptional LysR family regulator
MPAIRFCMSPDLPWDLLRTFEVVARRGSLTAAAKALGVSQSTISRHLMRLEEGAGSPLLLRESPVRLTRRGAALLSALQPMVDAALAARAALESAPEPQGQVTLSTVGELARWALVGRLASFYRAYPRLRLRILATNQISSLAAGEADVALRMVRPERGELVARKVGAEPFALHASTSLGLGPDVPWLGLTGSLSALPEQRHAERAFRSRPPRLLVEDVESLGVAVQASLGVAILPRQLASRLDHVAEVRPSQVGAHDLGPVASRGVWVVVHRAKQDLPNVRALIGWLEAAFADPNAPAPRGLTPRAGTDFPTQAQVFLPPTSRPKPSTWSARATRA